MNWQECGRKLSCQTLRYYSKMFLDGLRKTTEKVVGIADLWVENRTHDLPNTKQE
jgi:hypothetical protein